MKKSLIRRRCAALALAVCLAFPLAGCRSASSPSQAAEPPVLSDTLRPVPYRFGVGYSGEGYTEVFTRWRDLVLEDTGGNVELELFGSNILGEGKDMLRAVKRGTLSIMASSTSVHTELVEDAAVMDVPACFEEYVQPYTVYGGAFFDALNACYREKGLELLYLQTGEPWIIATKHPVEQLSALDHMHLRTSGSLYHDRLYEAMGMTCVDNVGLAGIPYLLEEGRAEGIETTYAILRSEALTESLSYALEAPLFVMSSAVVMNREAWDLLPGEYQEIVRSRLRELLSQRVEAARNGVQLPVQVRVLTPEDRSLLREIAAPLLEEISRRVGKDLLESLREENLGSQRRD